MLMICGSPACSKAPFACVKSRATVSGAAPKSVTSSAVRISKSHISASMIRPRIRSSPVKAWPRAVEKRPSRIAAVWLEVAGAFWL